MWLTPWDLSSSTTLSRNWAPFALLDPKPENVLLVYENPSIYNEIRSGNLPSLIRSKIDDCPRHVVRLTDAPERHILRKRLERCFLATVVCYRGNLHQISPHIPGMNRIHPNVVSVFG